MSGSTPVSITDATQASAIDGHYFGTPTSNIVGITWNNLHTGYRTFETLTYKTWVMSDPTLVIQETSRIVYFVECSYAENAASIGKSIFIDTIIHPSGNAIY